MKKFFFATLVACAAFVACNGSKEPAGPTASISVDKNFTDGVANGKITLSAAASTDATFELSVAASSQVKAADVTIEPAILTIAAGETEGAFKLTLGELEPGDYSCTVTFTSSLKIEIAEATAKATVEPELLMAVDMHNYKINSTFLFKENSVNTGSNYTFEWKFMPYHWHTYNGKEVEDQVDGQEHTTFCNRLGQVCNEDEKGILVRFGDGQAAGSLRVNGSKYFDDGNSNDYFGHGKDSWALDQWHTLSIVVDGTTLTVYDNGELFGTMPVKEDGVNGFPFERLALSMEWGYDANGLDYPLGQDFHGYIEYIRFWQKALTQEEIKAGLCKVSKTAEGLASLWIFNTDSGSVIPDQVGPRNLDYSTNAYVWYSANKNPAPAACGEAMLEQWVEWDEATMGPMCPTFEL